MPKYFAYGSNISERRVGEQRKVPYTSRQFAVLKDYELLFDKVSATSGKGYANIVPAKGKHVEGFVYDTTEEGIAILDNYEGYPVHYERKRVIVKTATGMMEAKAYVAPPSQRSKGLLPSRDYLDYLLEGREDFSKDYLERLENQPVFER
ncbi:MAG: gamma-glutamylcyclotransferase family protein [Planctomycetota bacterium]|nr:gamma-glutamylcyclotransferase family protein [Planctomycetota bacterium]